MSGRFLFVGLLAFLALLAPSVAAAQQDASPRVAPDGAPSTMIVTTPTETPVLPTPLEYQLDEAADRSRRVRSALIGTSAAFGAGLIFAGIGASQCYSIRRPYVPEELVCNTAGDVLLGFGVTFITAGAIGMLTSGIMLGVRNKQRRELERNARRRPYGSRFHWNVESGRFVF
ncbi:MAG: hypothetical protein WBM46_20105 [Polyangiales bacterium]